MLRADELLHDRNHQPHVGADDRGRGRPRLQPARTPPRARYSRSDTQDRAASVGHWPGISNSFIRRNSSASAAAVSSSDSQSRAKCAGRSRGSREAGVACSASSGRPKIRASERASRNDRFGMKSISRSRNLRIRCCNSDGSFRGAVFDRIAVFAVRRRLGCFFFSRATDMTCSLKLGGVQRVRSGTT